MSFVGQETERKQVSEAVPIVHSATCLLFRRCLCVAPEALWSRNAHLSGSLASGACFGSPGGLRLLPPPILVGKGQVTPEAWTG